MPHEQQRMNNRLIQFRVKVMPHRCALPPRQYITKRIQRHLGRLECEDCALLNHLFL